MKTKLSGVLLIFLLLVALSAAATEHNGPAPPEDLAVVRQSLSISTSAQIQGEGIETQAGQSRRSDVRGPLSLEANSSADWPLLGEAGSRLFTTLSVNRTTLETSWEWTTELDLETQVDPLGQTSAHSQAVGNASLRLELHSEAPLDFRIEIDIEDNDGLIQAGTLFLYDPSQHFSLHHRLPGISHLAPVMSVGRVPAGGVVFECDFEARAVSRLTIQDNLTTWTQGQGRVQARVKLVLSPGLWDVPESPGLSISQGSANKLRIHMTNLTPNRQYFILNSLNLQPWTWNHYASFWAEGRELILEISMPRDAPARFFQIRSF